MARERDPRYIPGVPLDPQRPCLTCGIPLTLGRGGRGRCNACYTYLLTTGQDRPRHLYARFAEWQRVVGAGRS